MSGSQVPGWYAPSTQMPAPGARRGPFKADQIDEGDRYELSRGHPVYVAPAGGRHGREQLVGALPIATDPAVTEAGLDVGYTPDEHTLRAPDIAVGNVPDRPGWVKGAPTLAIEYADRGTDEDELEAKIAELLAAGTRLVWVVRLVGPRRVDVHPSDGEPFTVGSGGTLQAEGILSRSLPVDALFDLEQANAVAFENLLRRHGYGTLDDVRTQGRTEGHAEGRAEGRAEGHAEGRAEGHAEGLRRAVEASCSLLGIALDEPRRERLAQAGAPELETLLEALLRDRAWPE